MAMTGAQVAAEARDALFDLAKRRWTDPDIIRYINDASKAIVDVVPTAFTVRTDMQLEPGVVQDLPEDGLIVLRVARNTNGRAIRRVSLPDMDGGHPDWVDAAQSTTTRQYMVDESTPHQFLVYPPSNGLGSVEVVYAATPPLITSLPQDLPLRETYKLAYVNYVLYRAYARDADYAANRDLATWYFQQFAQGLGVKFEARMSEMPTQEAPA